MSLKVLNSKWKEAFDLEQLLGDENVQNGAYQDILTHYRSALDKLGARVSTQDRYKYIKEDIKNLMDECNKFLKNLDESQIESSKSASDTVSSLAGYQHRLANRMGVFEATLVDEIASSSKNEQKKIRKKSKEVKSLQSDLDNRLRSAILRVNGKVTSLKRVEDLVVSLEAFSQEIRENLALIEPLKDSYEAKLHDLTLLERLKGNTVHRIGEISELGMSVSSLPPHSRLHEKSNTALRHCQELLSLIDQKIDSLRVVAEKHKKLDTVMESISEEIRSTTALSEDLVAKVHEVELIASEVSQETSDEGKQVIQRNLSSVQAKRDLLAKKAVTRHVSLSEQGDPTAEYIREATERHLTLLQPCTAASDKTGVAAKLQDLFCELSAKISELDESSTDDLERLRSAVGVSWEQTQQGATLHQEFEDKSATLLDEWKCQLIEFAAASGPHPYANELRDQVTSDLRQLHEMASSISGETSPAGQELLAAQLRSCECVAGELLEYLADSQASLEERFVSPYERYEESIKTYEAAIDAHIVTLDALHETPVKTLHDLHDIQAALDKIKDAKPELKRQLEFAVELCGKAAAMVSQSEDMHVHRQADTIEKKWCDFLDRLKRTNGRFDTLGIMLQEFEEKRQRIEGQLEQLDGSLTSAQNEGEIEQVRSRVALVASEIDDLRSTLPEVEEIHPCIYIQERMESVSYKYSVLKKGLVQKQQELPQQRDAPLPTPDRAAMLLESITNFVQYAFDHTILPLDELPSLKSRLTAAETDLTQAKALGVDEEACSRLSINLVDIEKMIKKRELEAGNADAVSVCRTSLMELADDIRRTVRELKQSFKTAPATPEEGNAVGRKLSTFEEPFKNFDHQLRRLEAQFPVQLRDPNCEEMEELQELCDKVRNINKNLPKAKLWIEEHGRLIQTISDQLSQFPSRVMEFSSPDELRTAQTEVKMVEKNLNQLAQINVDLEVVGDISLKRTEALWEEFDRIKVGLEGQNRLIDARVQHSNEKEIMKARLSECENELARLVGAILDDPEKGDRYAADLQRMESKIDVLHGSMLSLSSTSSNQERLERIEKLRGRIRVIKVFITEYSQLIIRIKTTMHDVTTEQVHRYTLQRCLKMQERLNRLSADFDRLTDVKVELSQKFDVELDRLDQNIRSLSQERDVAKERVESHINYLRASMSPPVITEIQQDFENVVENLSVGKLATLEGMLRKVDADTETGRILAERINQTVHLVTEHKQISETAESLLAQVESVDFFSMPPEEALALNDQLKVLRMRLAESEEAEQNFSVLHRETHTLIIRIETIIQIVSERIVEIQRSEYRKAAPRALDEDLEETTAKVLSPGQLAIANLESVLSNLSVESIGDLTQMIQQVDLTTPEGKELSERIATALESVNYHEVVAEESEKMIAIVETIDLGSMTGEQVHDLETEMEAILSKLESLRVSEEGLPALQAVTKMLILRFETVIEVIREQRLVIRTREERGHMTKEDIPVLHGVREGDESTSPVELQHEPEIEVLSAEEKVRTSAVVDNVKSGIQSVAEKVSDPGVKTESEPFTEIREPNLSYVSDVKKGNKEQVKATPEVKNNLEHLQKQTSVRDSEVGQDSTRSEKSEPPRSKNEKRKKKKPTRRAKKLHFPSASDNTDAPITTTASESSESTMAIESDRTSPLHSPQEADFVTNAKQELSRLANQVRSILSQFTIESISMSTLDDIAKNEEELNKLIPSLEEMSAIEMELAEMTNVDSVVRPLSEGRQKALELLIEQRRQLEAAPVINRMESVLGIFTEEYIQTLSLDDAEQALAKLTDSELSDYLKSTDGKPNTRLDELSNLRENITELLQARCVDLENELPPDYSLILADLKSMSDKAEAVLSKYDHDFIAGISGPELSDAENDLNSLVDDFEAMGQLEVEVQPEVSFVDPLVKKRSELLEVIVNRQHELNEQRKQAVKPDEVDTELLLADLKALCQKVSSILSQFDNDSIAKMTMEHLSVVENALNPLVDDFEQMGLIEMELQPEISFLDPLISRRSELIECLKNRHQELQKEASKQTIGQRDSETEAPGEADLGKGDSIGALPENDKDFTVAMTVLKPNNEGDVPDARVNDQSSSSTIISSANLGAVEHQSKVSTTVERRLEEHFSNQRNGVDIVQTSENLSQSAVTGGSPTAEVLPADYVSRKDNVEAVLSQYNKDFIGKMTTIREIDDAERALNLLVDDLEAMDFVEKSSVKPLTQLKSTILEYLINRRHELENDQPSEHTSQPSPPVDSSNAAILQDLTSLRDKVAAVLSRYDKASIANLSVSELNDLENILNPLVDDFEKMAPLEMELELEVSFITPLSVKRAELFEYMLDRRCNLLSNELNDDLDSVSSKIFEALSGEPKNYLEQMQSVKREVTMIKEKVATFPEKMKPDAPDRTNDLENTIDRLLELIQAFEQKLAVVNKKLSHVPEEWIVSMDFDQVIDLESTFSDIDTVISDLTDIENNISTLGNVSLTSRLVEPKKRLNVLRASSQARRATLEKDKSVSGIIVRIQGIQADMTQLDKSTEKQLEKLKDEEHIGQKADNILQENFSALRDLVDLLNDVDITPYVYGHPELANKLDEAKGQGQAFSGKLDLVRNLLSEHETHYDHIESTLAAWNNPDAMESFSKEEFGTVRKELIELRIILGHMETLATKVKENYDVPYIDERKLSLDTQSSQVEASLEHYEVENAARDHFDDLRERVDNIVEEFHGINDGYLNALGGSEPASILPRLTEVRTALGQWMHTAGQMEAEFEQVPDKFKMKMEVLGTLKKGISEGSDLATCLAEFSKLFNSWISGFGELSFLFGDYTAEKIQEIEDAGAELEKVKSFDRQIKHLQKLASDPLVYDCSLISEQYDSIMDAYDVAISQLAQRAEQQAYSVEQKNAASAISKAKLQLHEFDSRLAKILDLKVEKTPHENFTISSRLVQSVADLRADFVTYIANLPTLLSSVLTMSEENPEFGDYAAKSDDLEQEVRDFEQRLEEYAAQLVDLIAKLAEILTMFERYENLASVGNDEIKTAEEDIFALETKIDEADSLVNNMEGNFSCKFISQVLAALFENKQALVDRIERHKTVLETTSEYEQYKLKYDSLAEDFGKFCEELDILSAGSPSDDTQLTAELNQMEQLRKRCSQLESRCSTLDGVAGLPDSMPEVQDLKKDIQSIEEQLKLQSDKLAELRQKWNEVHALAVQFNTANSQFDRSSSHVTDLLENGDLEHAEGLIEECDSHYADVTTATAALGELCPQMIITASNRAAVHVDNHKRLVLYRALHTLRAWKASCAHCSERYEEFIANVEAFPREDELNGFAVLNSEFRAIMNELSSEAHDRVVNAVTKYPEDPECQELTNTESEIQKLWEDLLTKTQETAENLRFWYGKIQEYLAAKGQFGTVLYKMGNKCAEMRSGSDDHASLLKAAEALMLEAESMIEPVAQRFSELPPERQPASEKERIAGLRQRILEFRGVLLFNRLRLMRQRFHMPPSIDLGDIDTARDLIIPPDQINSYEELVDMLKKLESSLECTKSMETVFTDLESMDAPTLANPTPDGQEFLDLYDHREQLRANAVKADEMWRAVLNQWKPVMGAAQEFDQHSRGVTETMDAARERVVTNDLTDVHAKIGKIDGLVNESELKSTALCDVSGLVYPKKLVDQLKNELKALKKDVADRECCAELVQEFRTTLEEIKESLHFDASTATGDEIDAYELKYNGQLDNLERLSVIILELSSFACFPDGERAVLDHQVCEISDARTRMSEDLFHRREQLIEDGNVETAKLLEQEFMKILSSLTDVFAKDVSSASAEELEEIENAYNDTDKLERLQMILLEIQEYPSFESIVNLETKLEELNTLRSKQGDAIANRQLDFQREEEAIATCRELCKTWLLDVSKVVVKANDIADAPSTDIDDCKLSLLQLEPISTEIEERKKDFQEVVDVCKSIFVELPSGSASKVEELIAKTAETADGHYIEVDHAKERLQRIVESWTAFEEARKGINTSLDHVLQQIKGDATVDVPDDSYGDVMEDIANRLVGLAELKDRLSDTRPINSVQQGYEDVSGRFVTVNDALEVGFSPVSLASLVVS